MNENKITPINVVDFLEHSGVKGMRWGVTNDNKSSGGGNFFDSVNALPRKERRAEYKILEKDAKWSGGIAKQKDGIAVYNATAKRMNETHLPDLNGRPEYKGKNVGANPKLLAKYNKDYAALVEKASSDAIDEVHGTSPSGRMKARLGKDPSGQMYVEIVATDPDAVWHAQMDAPLPDNTFRFHLETDENGLITAMHPTPTKVMHSEDTFDVATFFEHSGVKGMKWGVRNPEKKAARASAKEAARTSAKLGSSQHRSSRSNKARYMTTADLEQAIKRIETEKKYNSLTQSASSKGHKTVKSVLGDIGKKSITEVGTKAASHAMKTIIFKKFKVDLGKSSFADVKI